MIEPLDEKEQQRLASQNARQAKSRAKGTARGTKRKDLALSETEHALLAKNCKIRGGSSGPYSRAEYIATLIRRDNERLRKQLSRLGDCAHCQKALPEGCHGESKGQLNCWLTKGEKRLAL